MSKRIIKHIIMLAIIAGLIIPAPALAAVNSSPSSAAADGIRYLNDNQNADGSIPGFGGESEWSADAVAASGQDVAGFSNGGSSLLDFLKSDASSSSTSAATLERKIIAIATAGQDPSNFGDVDYISLLAAKHTGGQIRDNDYTTVLTDDFFGIIAIDAAHDTSLLPEAQDALDYMLDHQAPDGGFSWSADYTCDFCGPDSSDTAAALIAMYAASDLGLSPSDTTINLDLKKSEALGYLLTTKQGDGGFGGDMSSPSDGSSTAWSLMALNMVGSSVDSSAASARDWLLQNQNVDGGFSYGAFGITASDTYTTANAVLALLGTTWLLNPAPTPIAVQPPQPPTSSGTSSGGSPEHTVSSDSDTGYNGHISGFKPEPAQTASGQTTPDSQGTGNGSTKDDVGISGVKGAGTSVPAKPDDGSENKSNHKSAAYGAAVLILVALIWFMLESRKGHGVKK